MRRLLTILSLLGLALSSALSGLLIARPNLVRAYTSPGKPVGYVNDYAKVLSDSASTDINRDLDEFASQSSNQIFVVLINSLDGDTIDNYANELFREWKIGTEEKNNGVLFVASIGDRLMRIEVGYGLEGAITDLETSRMQENLVRPAFKEGDYEGGIRSLISALKTAAAGEYNVPYTATKKASNWSFEYIFWAFFVFSWFASFLARSKSWWAGGVVGLIIAALCWIFADSMALKIIVSVLAPPIGLLLDYIVSKNYKKNISSGGHGGFFGTFGGFSSGGGGGGSFGGGFGGSSGGGGSSSSW